jgi:hypothetical protein
VSGRSFRTARIAGIQQCAESGPSHPRAQLSSHRLVSPQVRRHAENCIAIHTWFGEPRAIIAYFRQRAYHHVERNFLAERIFGVTITSSAGRAIAMAPHRRAVIQGPLT